MGNGINQIKTSYYQIMSYLKTHYYLLLLIPIIGYAYSLYDRHTHMNDDDLSWMDVYTGTDTRLFITPDGSIDTMHIKRKEIWNSCSLFWEGPIGGLYLAGGQYDYIIIHDKDSIVGSMSISKQEKRKPVWLDFQFGGRFGLGIKQNFKGTIIKGIKYHDCIFVNDTNSEIPEYNNCSITISDFIWSKSYGLLEYTLSNGVTYHLCR